MSTRQAAFVESRSAQAPFAEEREAPSFELKAADLVSLADFMRRVLIVINDHPEWRVQSPPERMDNILEALRNL